MKPPKNTHLLKNPQDEIKSIILAPGADVILENGSDGMDRISITLKGAYGNPSIQLYRSSCLLWHTYSVSVNFIPIDVPSPKLLWQTAMLRLALDSQTEVVKAIDSLKLSTSNIKN